MNNLRETLLLTFFLFLTATFVTNAQGFKVSGTKLLDANGNEFIMRGINFPYAWWQEKTDAALPAIASFGANTVRIVLANGEQWEKVPADEVKQLIELCKDLKMIAVLEVHDCTGGMAHISTAVDYWIDIKDIVMGEEAYVIINIANEPHDNEATEEQWINDWSEAIKALRKEGFTHNIMVDAANWGQDWKKIMYNNAQKVFDADPLQNITFSVHMYQVYSDSADVYEYLEHFAKNLKLPLLVGEFGMEHFNEPVAYDAIFSATNKYNQGYIGWSWSGNSPEEIEVLDMVYRSDWSTLTKWGKRIIYGNGGIQETSQIATVFADTSE